MIVIWPHAWFWIAALYWQAVDLPFQFNELCRIFCDNWKPTSSVAYGMHAMDIIVLLIGGNIEILMP